MGQFFQGNKGENIKIKMSNFVQSFDSEYDNKKETGNWNRKGLVQTKKDDQASRQDRSIHKNESVKNYKDSNTPSVKYSNRVYRSWEAREECNQNYENYKS